MKKTAIPILLGLVLGLLAACSRPASLTPTALPTASTPVVPTSSPLPPAAAPAPITSLTGLNMMDAGTGWAWATRPDNSASLLYTRDGGQTWSDVTPNLPVVSFGGFFLDAQTAWVQSYDSDKNTNSLVFTADAGKSWKVTNPDLPFSNAGLTFQSATTGWAETYDVGAGQAYVKLYLTQDGGATWTQAALTDPVSGQAGPDGALHLCNICGDTFSYDPARTVVTSGELANEPSGSVNLSISTDTGKTWKNLKLPLPGSQFKGFVNAPQMPVFFSALDGLLPVYLVDDAASAPTSPRIAVYVTADGGLTWKARPTFVENAAAFGQVNFVSLQDGFTRCGPDLCATHDGAQTWTDLAPSGLDFSSSATTDYVFKFDFADAQTGWAITTDGTTATLWKTADGGATWTKLAPVLAP